MNEKYFMEKSCVVASIMCTKCERLGQNFVTFDELNAINEELQKEFIKNRLNVEINDFINDNYFNIQDGIILLNDFTLQDIREKYYSGVENNFNNALDIVWNNDFIIKNILKIRRKELDFLRQSISNEYSQTINAQITNKAFIKR